MKILLINKFLRPVGGAETYMFKLGKYLQNGGHEVQYFGMEDERNIVGNHVGEYAKNVDYHGKQHISPLKLGINTIYSKANREKLQKVLEDFKPDVAHLNNINFQLTPSIIYELKKKHIPIFQTVHDVQIACPCHRFYIEHKQRICTSCKKNRFYQCVLNRCVQRSFSKSVIAAAESYYYHCRNAYNLVDRYICPSQFIAEQIMEAGVDRERIIVRHNFSDVVEPNMLSVEKKGYALYFGRFSEEKGIRTLLNVCDEMTDIEFVFAGSGPMEKEVIKFCEQHINCTYVGFQSGEALKKLIAEALFSIYPSEWYENCPLSVVESIALGTPVISSDLGGTKELIQDWVTGIVFRGGSKDSLRNAILTLYHDKELLQKMSNNCICTKQCSIEEYAEELEKQYALYL